MTPKPISQKNLNKILAKVSHDPPKKIDLLAHVQEYNQALLQLAGLKREHQWKIILEPELFKRAEQKLISAREDLKSGHVLDSRASDWTRHMEKYREAVEKLKDHRVDDKIKGKFRVFFEGAHQKSKADEFMEADY